VDAVVKQFDLFLTYDHDVMQLIRVDQSATLTEAWPTPGMHIGMLTDTLSFSNTLASLGMQGPLAHLLFRTYVTDTSATSLVLTSTLPGTLANCPTIFSTGTTGLFEGKGLCGDSLFRHVMAGEKIVIQSIRVEGGGATASLVVTIQSPIEQMVDITIVDLLGRPIWSGKVHIYPGHQQIRVALPIAVASGEYIFRLEAERHAVSRAVLVGK